MWMISDVMWPSEEQQREQEAKLFAMHGEFTAVTVIKSMPSSFVH